jgi:hypothetical protein
MSFTQTCVNTCMQINQVCALVVPLWYCSKAGKQNEPFCLGGWQTHVLYLSKLILPLKFWNSWLNPPSLHPENVYLALPTSPCRAIALISTNKLKEQFNWKKTQKGKKKSTCRLHMRLLKGRAGGLTIMTGSDTRKGCFYQPCQTLGPNQICILQYCRYPLGQNKYVWGWCYAKGSAFTNLLQGIPAQKTW